MQTQDSYPVGATVRYIGPAIPPKAGGVVGIVHGTEGTIHSSSMGGLLVNVKGVPAPLWFPLETLALVTTD